MCKTKQTTRSIPQADLTRNNHAPAWPPSYTITQTEETKQIKGQRRMAQTGVSKTETGYQRCCSDHSNTSDGTFEDQHGLANKSQTDGTWYTKQKQIMTATYSIYTAAEMRTIPMPHLCASAILPPHQGIRPSTRYR